MSRQLGRASLVLAAFVLGACDRLPGRPLEAERYVRPDAVLDASVLFAANCSGCHGEPGRVGPARNLADPLYLAVIGRTDLRRVIALGVPGTSMPAFAQAEGGWLTEAQVDALADGILSRWSTPDAFRGQSLPAWSAAAAERAGVAPGDPARGARVFARACASCHGADGSTGAGGSIVDGAYLELMSDQALRSAVVAGRPELDMPSYRGESGDAPLDAQEISDVTAWLISKRPPVPGEEPGGDAVARVAR